MRYLCTIYTQDYTFSGTTSFAGTEPTFTEPAATVEVRGEDRRDAAARAYIRCVGRQRAQEMRAQMQAPKNVIAQETNRKAIAASLRKSATRMGECYQLDNFVAAWFIKVEPVVNRVVPPVSASAEARGKKPSRSPRLHKLHLPASLLLRHSQSPSPN